ncbi:MAG: outer membrane beta-barrel protein [Betaproteobacteria bacterium]
MNVPSLFPETPMHTLRSLCRVLILASCLAPLGAYAQPAPLGFYVGAGAGESHFRSDYASQVNQAYEGTGFTVDSARVTEDQDTAWKAYAGWRFHRYGAVEVGYLDFGRATTNYQVGVPGIGSAVRDGRYRLSGVELSLVGTVPVGDRGTVFAKAGGLVSTLKYDESGVDQFGAPASFSHDNRHTLFLWGLGGAYEFVDGLSVRVEWQRAEDAGERFALTDSGNGRFEHVDLISASLQWRFR